MKTLKQLTALLMIGILLLSVGCSNDEVETNATGQTEKQEVKKEAASKDVTHYGVFVRSLTNPYFVEIVEGAELFVATLPEGTADIQVFACEGSDEKQINDVKSFLTTYGEDAVIYFDPNNSPNTAVVADLCEEAGAYWSSTWSMADGVVPADYEYYVFHQTVDNEFSGYQIAKALCEAMNGEGKMLAIQGSLSNTASINRTIGLEKALEEYPGVELLDVQPGDWNPQTSLQLTQTWLTTYDDVDAIWAANDDMALAALEALKAAGKEDVLVAGMDAAPAVLDLLKENKMAATISNNALAQSGYALAILTAAKNGELDTGNMTDEQMMHNTNGMLITADNVADYYENYINNKPTFDYSDIFGNVASPINQ